MYTASDQPGQAVVQVTCPNCISSTLQLTAFKLLLDKPEIASNYEFHATTSKLTVEFQARVDPDTPDVRDYLNGKVDFGMDPIGESQAQWTSPGSGAAVYSNGAYGASVTFTNLPSSNSDFGPKGAWLTVVGWGRVVERTGDNRPKIFYCR